MNFNKVDLIDAVMLRYYQTFNLTLDTVDFVPEKVNDMILRYITKNLKKSFKSIDGENRKYQKRLHKETKQAMREKLRKEYAKHEQKTETLPMSVGSAESGDSTKLCETGETI